jgi:hypothetical protein
MSENTVPVSADTYLDTVPVERIRAAVPDNPLQIGQTARAVKAEIVDHPEDTTRMDIVFLIESRIPYHAFHYALQPELAEFGAKLCRREGLSDVGLSERSVPIPCDKDGKTLTDFYLQDDKITSASKEGYPEEGQPEGERNYYYRVVFSYLGED